MAAALVLSVGQAQAGGYFQSVRAFFHSLAQLVTGAPPPAKNYGDWLCLDCHLNPPGTGSEGSPVEAITMYIKINNDDIHEGEGLNTRWTPGSTITICDGTSCMTVIYHASGMWIPKPNTYTTPDGGRQKKTPRNGPYQGTSLNVPPRPQLGFVGTTWTGDNTVWISLETWTPRVLTPSITVIVVPPEQPPLGAPPPPPTVTYSGPVDAMPNAPGQDLFNEDPGVYPEFPNDGSGGGASWGGGGGVDSCWGNVTGGGAGSNASLMMGGGC